MKTTYGQRAVEQIEYAIDILKMGLASADHADSHTAMRADMIALEKAAALLVAENISTDVGTDA